MTPEQKSTYSYIRTLIEWHQLTKDGDQDSPAADMLGDRMDSYWKTMDDFGRDISRKVSSTMKNEYSDHHE